MFTIFSNQNYFQIKSETVSLYWSNQLNWADLSQENSVFLSSDKNTAHYWSSHKSLINNVGQYSQLGFEIESFNSEAGKLGFKVKHDSVTLALIDNLDPELHVTEKIGEPNILVVRVDSKNAEKMLSVSQNSNSKMIILLTEPTEREAVKQIFTQNLTEIENGYKIRSKDLNTETTQYFILN
jgi:flagellar hook-length control protein FliK